MVAQKARGRPYGWRQQLAVGLAILVFVVGAPWAAFEVSRRPLLARAAAIGERICRLAVEGTLGPRDAAVKVRGIGVLGIGQSARLIGMAEALKDDCYYAVREGDLDGEREATHILTIANYPTGDTNLPDFQYTMNSISLRISYHLFWTPLMLAFGAIIERQPFRLNFLEIGYSSGDWQFTRTYPVTASVLRARGHVSGI